jgi:uncharacterized membrane protein YjgN (DUF898 family)
LSKPAPAADAQAALPDEPGLPRLPRGVVTSWPVRFKAEPNEFGRLWLQNLLLIALTGGLYLPWARVRSQRFLMRHTHVAGHRLDYHEPATRLLPRYGLALCLVLGVAGAWAGSPLAGMLALSLALSVWPLLMFMSLNQRLAHISWGRQRLAFDARCQDVYRAMWAPLAGGGALAWLLMAAAIVSRPAGWLGWVLALALWLLALPTFVWAWFRFRQTHVRLGPLRLVWQGTRPAVQMVLVRTLVWAMLTSVVSAGLGAVVLAAVLRLRGQVQAAEQVTLALVCLLAVGAAVLPYAQARLQNLVWNKSGNRYLRFRSKLSVSGYVALQCRQALLVVLTLGLYWPWAVVASRRMRSHALQVCARVDADVLKAHWPAHKRSDAR